MKKIAYLEVQIPVRDLDARILLAHKLIDLGFEVILGRTGEVFNAALSNEGGVYFSDFGYSTAGATKLKVLKQRGIEVFLFCEEVLAVARWDTYQVERVDAEALELSNQVLVNGGFHKEIILQKLGGNYDFVNLGNSRFDLLEQRYRGIYEASVKHIRQKYGDFVLVCTNGAVGDVSNFARRMNVEGFKHSLINQEMIGLMALQQYFVIEILKLAKLRSDLTFVIRAKPGEESIIKNLAPIDLGNVHFDCSESIRPWVLAATHVVSNCCSTAFDALAAETPSIVFQPKGWCAIKSEATDYVSYETNTIDELSSALDSITCVKHLSKDDLEYYFPNKIGSSTEKLAALMDKSMMAAGVFENKIAPKTLRHWRWFLKRKYLSKSTQWTGLISFKEISYVLLQLDRVGSFETTIQRLGAEIYLIKAAPQGG